ncbi:MAG: hypothetical protein V7752_08550 [Halopseudomonas sp.]
MVQLRLGSAVTVGLVAAALLTGGCAEPEQGQGQAAVAPVTSVTLEPAVPVPVPVPVPSEPALKVSKSSTQALDLSVDRQLLLGDGAAKGGFSNPATSGEEPSAASSSSSTLNGRFGDAPKDDKTLSFSGSVLTKEDEPDYRNSVEGAKVGLELKY